MSDTYYPRHGEQSVEPDELHMAWLEDRVRVLEALLAECKSKVNYELVVKIDAALRESEP